MWLDNDFVDDCVDSDPISVAIELLIYIGSLSKIINISANSQILTLRVFAIKISIATGSFWRYRFPYLEISKRGNIQN